MTFLKKFSIASELYVGSESPPIVVAEIGLNHNNDEEIGKKTIAAAKKGRGTSRKISILCYGRIYRRPQSGREDSRGYIQKI